MGDDITLGNNKVKHFKWCWDQVINSFKMEGIYFLETKELYGYFLIFYQESFYEEEKEENKEEEVEAEEIYFADTTSAAGLDMLQALWYCHFCFFKSLHILGSLRRCFIVEKC